MEWPALCKVAPPGVIQLFGDVSTHVEQIDSPCVKGDGSLSRHLHLSDIYRSNLCCLRFFVDGWGAGVASAFPYTPNATGVTRMAEAEMFLPYRLTGNIRCVPRIINYIA